MVPLVSAVDLAARLGRDLTDAEQARVDALLADASALIRAYTGQDFAPGTNTVILRASGGMLRLPQRPVSGVSQIVAIGLNGGPDLPVVDYWWDGTDLIRLGAGDWVINLPEDWHDTRDGWPGTYRVTYTVDAVDVPEDIVMVGCRMVMTTLTAPTLIGGITGETIGPYSYRMEAAGIGTSVTLSDADKIILNRYRRTAGTISTRTY